VVDIMNAGGNSIGVASIYEECTFLCRVFVMSSFIIVELAWRWPGGGEAQGRAGRRDAVCRGKGMAEKICGEGEEMWDPEHGGREAGLQLPIYHIELLFGSVEAII